MLSFGIYFFSNFPLSLLCFFIKNTLNFSDFCSSAKDFLLSSQFQPSKTATLPRSGCFSLSIHQFLISTSSTLRLFLPSPPYVLFVSYFLQFSIEESLGDLLFPFTGFAGFSSFFLAHHCFFSSYLVLLTWLCNSFLYHFLTLSCLLISSFFSKCCNFLFNPSSWAKVFLSTSIYYFSSSGTLSPHKSLMTRRLTRVSTEFV